MAKPENAESGSEAEARKQAAPRRPKYCGLLLCRQGGAAAPAAAGGMAAQGMSGSAPLLRGINVVREFGLLQHPNNHGWVAKPGLWEFVCTYCTTLDYLDRAHMFADPFPCHAGTLMVRRGGREFAALWHCALCWFAGPTAAGLAALPASLPASHE